MDSDWIERISIMKKMSKMKEIISSERFQYIVFLVLSLGIKGFTGIPSKDEP